MKYPKEVQDSLDAEKDRAFELLHVMMKHYNNLPKPVAEAFSAKLKATAWAVKCINTYFDSRES